jgi:hypothetical protein
MQVLRLEVLDLDVLNVKSDPPVIFMRNMSRGACVRLETIGGTTERKEREEKCGRRKERNMVRYN